ncbi:MAG TPA: hypothetical protein VF412_00775 [Bdellovibrio sp.]|uniref:hypothetical protein n=1 Tax=Bdellovibrio sp. TaxID=28201 RepID=UPI002F1EE0BB
MKFASLISATALSLSLVAVPRPSQAGWGWGFLEPAKIIEKIRQQIAKQDIGVGVGLIDADILNGFSTALRYRLESEPSYLDGFYTRVDKYTLQADVNPGDLIDGNDSPIGFNMQSGTDVIFARQFKTQKESLLAMPYSIKNIPLNANRALRNLHVGDFVALQGHLEIVFSVGTNSDLNGAISLGGSTHVFLSGDFMIHLFRMENDKIRVKLITMRKQGAGADAAVDYAGKFKIIGFKFIDNKIERWVDLTPASLGFGRSVNDVFMLDYVFDLKNPQAAQAYDDFMSKKVRFKDLKVIDPTASRPDLQNDLMTDMSGVEQLFVEDRDLPPEQRRVDRIFKGSNSSNDSNANFKLGLSIVKLSSKLVYSQNQLMNYDRNDNEQHYLLDTYSKEVESKILYGLFGDKITDGNNLVFNSNAAWAPGSFLTLTAYREVKMRDVSSRDYRKVQDQVRRAIPPDQYAKIDWKDWNFNKGHLVNGYFRQQLFINPEAIHQLPVQNTTFYYNAFVDYVDKTGAPPSRGASHENYWTDGYNSDLMTISLGLAAIVNPLSSNAQIYQNFKAMQKLALWRERGIGFILSMIPDWRGNSLVSYEMTFSAKGVEAVNYKFGTFINEELYRSLMYIQNIINDRSFDLRLLTDSSTGELKGVN